MNPNNDTHRPTGKLTEADLDAQRAPFPGGDMQGRYTDHSTEFDRIYDDEDGEPATFRDVWPLFAPVVVLMAVVVGAWLIWR